MTWPATIRSASALAAHVEAAARDRDAYFLGEALARLVWARAPTQACIGDFHSVKERPITWFADGQLDVTESCVDRHARREPGRAAIIWESDTPGERRMVTYGELAQRVERAAAALRDVGVGAGDRVVLYLGMTPEIAVAMLACARVGAVHSVVFGGFSARALRHRVIDSGARVVITQDIGYRGGRQIPLLATCQEALEGLDQVETVFVVARAGGRASTRGPRQRDWDEALAHARSDGGGAVVDAEAPLFILYTSGSTGAPKGLVHTRGGYLTWASYTTQHVFDTQVGDHLACVADCGWITGHTYVVYGPLCNGLTTTIFESTPTYPNPGRYWQIVEQTRPSVFYAAPTALRVLAAAGDEWVTQYDRSSLRTLGTVGEPIDPATWRWVHDVVGQGRCAVTDTWWQTETGGHCIAPLAAASRPKPGSASQALPGIDARILEERGDLVEGEGAGRLCIAHPWPGMARTLWGDHARFVATYFEAFAGLYFTGDGCRRDADGDLWITGRVDDVLNVSGHRIGTAEIESAIASVAGVAESAVVGYPHERKGQGVWAWVVLSAGSDDQTAAVWRARCNEAIRQAIGPHARIDTVVLAAGLPKTRSGKVMRRILRKIAEGQPEAVGDVSTLAEPAIVADLIARAAGQGPTRASEDTPEPASS